MIKVVLLDNAHRIQAQTSSLHLPVKSLLLVLHFAAIKIFWDFDEQTPLFRMISCSIIEVETMYIGALIVQSCGGCPKFETETLSKRPHKSDQ